MPAGIVRGIVELEDAAVGGASAVATMQASLR
jgi:hypothetical protein